MLLIKEVFAPHLNRSVKFGRRRSSKIYPHVRLGHYLDLRRLPAPPSSCDYSGLATSVLANPFDNAPTPGYPYGPLGNCVVAGGYHVTGVATGNAGDLFTATPNQIVRDYSAIGGYVPGDPSTDNGCDLQTAMRYWQTNGFADGTKLAGWAAIDATNVAEIQACLFLFENLYMGVELPNGWITPFPSANGFTWDLSGAPDPNNGHCIMSCGYDKSGVKIGTWGLLGTLTYQALAAYLVASAGGELYVLLTPDQLAQGQSVAPNGVAWSDLLADLASLGGNAPAPAPPAPSPPVTTLTLAQVQAAAGAGAAEGVASIWPASMPRT